jgi:hypothetical protein
MSNNDTSINAKTALEIVCLFLAQQGEPFKELGFASSKIAHEEIGKKFNRNPNSVKNIRDAYDRFTDSARVGWKPKSGNIIVKHLRETYTNYSGKSYEELLSLSKHILETMWVNFITRDILFERVASDQSSEIQVIPPDDGVSIVFSNTRKRSEAWFVLTIQQVINVLDDLIKNQNEILKQAKNYEKDGKTENLIIPKTYIIFFKEDFWRHSIPISDKVVSTALGTQSLPIFELLSKIIHFSNSRSQRKHKFLNLELSALQLAKNTLQNIQKPSEHISNLIGGENRIYYGAPGTGKSYKIDGIIKGQIYTRTVFHPDLQNSDFFGCLKPRMQGINVNYEFVPGPFIKALSEAYLNPSKPVYLVIEELNRAPAATVFGDLFLLLDRDDDGKGIYDVDFPSPESCEWFNNETGETDEKIFIPSNLFIYASMNSADQGVFPIDTAFRRRWQQEYLPLDYDNGPVGEISYVDEDNIRKIIKWESFVETLNNYLTSIDDLSIAEDRLLGQWFVKSKELDGKGIPEKILLYLWDDLLRHVGRKVIFDEKKIKTYGALTKAIEGHKHFLSKPFIEELNKKIDTHGEV